MAGESRWAEAHPFRCLGLLLGRGGYAPAGAPLRRLASARMLQMACFFVGIGGGIFWSMKGRSDNERVDRDIDAYLTTLSGARTAIRPARPTSALTRTHTHATRHTQTHTHGHTHTRTHIHMPTTRSVPKP